MMRWNTSCWIEILMLVCLALSVQSAEAGNILYVQQSPFTPDTDVRVVEYLQTTLGHTVTVVEHDDSAGISAALSTTELVMISSTVNSSTAVASFGGEAAIRALDKPILTWEDGAYDELGMSPLKGGNVGTDLYIANPGHALAAGLSGTVTVFTEESNRPYASSLGGGGIRIANLDSTTSDTSIFFYPKGSRMMAGAGYAKNDRLGFFLGDGGFDLLTEDGLKLFDAAIGYWLPPVTAVPGDTDGDGDVDLDDLFAVRNNFGTVSGATRADGDVAPHPDGDGAVNLDDLFSVRNNFGTGLVVVPEPVTLWLLAAGGLTMIRRRNRR